MFIMHNTPPGAGHSGRIIEATPGFLSLGNMSWFIIYFSLHNGKRENMNVKLLKKSNHFDENYSRQ